MHYNTFNKFISSDITDIIKKNRRFHYTHTSTISLLILNQNICRLRSDFYTDHTYLYYTQYQNNKMHGKDYTLINGILSNIENYYCDKLHGISLNFMSGTDNVILKIYDMDKEIFGRRYNNDYFNEWANIKYKIPTDWSSTDINWLVYNWFNNPIINK